MAGILPQQIFQAKNQKKCLIFGFLYRGTKKIAIFHTFGPFSDLFWYQINVLRLFFILISVVHLSNSILSAV